MKSFNYANFFCGKEKIERVGQSINEIECRNVLFIPALSTLPEATNDDYKHQGRELYWPFRRKLGAVGKIADDKLKAEHIIKNPTPRLSDCKSCRYLAAIHLIQSLRSAAPLITKQMRWFPGKYF